MPPPSINRLAHVCEAVYFKKKARSILKNTLFLQKNRRKWEKN
ncbi:MAG: hypothetical protein RL757_2628 [Bacteroidota bacterium]|jgi:hypothetical protein